MKLFYRKFHPEKSRGKRLPSLDKPSGLNETWLMNILFAGDVMLGRFVNQKLLRRRPEFPWGDTLPVFREADCRICNLECVISDKGRPWSATPKVFHFRSDLKNIETLKVAGIDAVSTANNHSLDYEYDALFEMLAALEEAGIRQAGAGRDLEEASKPAIFERMGRKAAFIAFTDNEGAWEAKEHKPGVHYVPVDEEDPRAKRLFDIVTAAEKTSDIVIVSAHWGPNWGYEPVPSHVPFAHRLIDSGAQIVFGHSCHVFQGVEFYREGVIIYSAGDFIDDYAVDEVEKNDESFLFIASANGGVSSLTLFPTVIEGFHASMAPPPRAGIIAAKMRSLSAGFGTRSEWDGEKERLKLYPRQ